MEGSLSSLLCRVIKLLVARIAFGNSNQRLIGLSNTTNCSNGTTMDKRLFHLRTCSGSIDQRPVVVVVRSRSRSRSLGDYVALDKMKKEHRKSSRCRRNGIIESGPGKQSGMEMQLALTTMPMARSMASWARNQITFGGCLAFVAVVVVVVVLCLPDEIRDVLVCARFEFANGKPLCLLVGSIGESYTYTRCNHST